jgi:hypothetical protein
VDELASFGKKQLNHRGAFFNENAPGNFHLMIEARVGQNLEATARRAAFWIVRTINEPWDAGLNHRSCAHAARLHGNEESRPREPVILEDPCSFAKNNNFRVGRRVAIADCAVAGARNHPAPMHQQRANGNLASSGRGASFLKRSFHKVNVG